MASGFQGDLVSGSSADTLDITTVMQTRDDEGVKQGRSNGLERSKYGSLWRWDRQECQSPICGY